MQIGDKVVYPMHGAGVIESMETREIMGEEKLYYVLKLPMGNMTVMIPVDNVENIGLREISSPPAGGKGKGSFEGKACQDSGKLE